MKNTPVNPRIGLEVVVYQPVQFKSFEEMKKYMLSSSSHLKVYPLCRDGIQTLYDTERAIGSYGQSSRQKKRYAKMIEKYLEGEFSEELKKLTRERGSDIGQIDSS